jgi:hypothetical protein
MKVFLDLQNCINYRLENNNFLIQKHSKQTLL